MILRGKKAAKGLVLGLLVLTLGLGNGDVFLVSAEETTVPVTVESNGAENGDAQNVSGENSEGKTEETPKTQAEIDAERGYTDMEMTRVKFAVFLCCCFGLGVSVLVALYGKPNDDLRYRFKKARKKRKKEEKRKQKLEKKALKDGQKDNGTDGNHQNEQ